MRKTYLTTTGKTTLSPASSCSRNEAGLQTNSLVMRAVHAIWPNKTALELKAATGASDRMIQYWIANKYSLSAADLAGLLRTEAGLAILENIMGAAKPVWWKRFKQSVERAMIRAELKALAKRQEQSEMDFE
jgi:hypothetical protein